MLTGGVRALTIVRRRRDRPSRWVSADAGSDCVVVARTDAPIVGIGDKASARRRVRELGVRRPVGLNGLFDPGSTRGGSAHGSTVGSQATWRQRQIGAWEVPDLHGGCMACSELSHGNTGETGSTGGKLEGHPTSMAHGDAVGPGGTGRELGEHLSLSLVASCAMHS